MKKINFLTLLAISVMLTGCGKSSNDPIKMTYYESDGTITMTESYKYDRKGRLIESVSDSKVSNSVMKTTYIYSGDVCLYSTNFKQNSETGEWENYSQTIYSYDTKNNRTTEVYGGFDGETFTPSMIDVYKYENGLLMTDGSYILDRETNSYGVLMVDNREYDDDNLLIKKSLYMEMDNVVSLTQYITYEYNAQGQLLSEKEYTPEGKTIGGTTYFYEEGKVTEIYSLVIDDESLETEERTKTITYYDEKDRITKIEYFFKSDEPGKFDLENYYIYEY